MAGLAAASRLASSGMPVSVFESAPQLGGRARGVDYRGIRLDNGQHILLGAYQETLALLKQAGVAEDRALMRLPLQLNMLDLMQSKNERAFSLKACTALPAPLHILTGLLFAKGMPLRVRFSAIQLMVWLKLKRFKLKQDEPLADFLQRKQQPEALIKNLWEPLCLAALNTPINQASAQVFLNVLRDSFAKGKSDSDLLLPRTDLSALLAQPLADWLRKQGCQIHTSSPVKSIAQTDTGFLLNGEHAFSHVIMACAPHQLKHIELPEAITKQLPVFDYQPITTVYLQFEEHLQLPRPMTGLVNSVSQWVLDRGRTSGQNGLLAVVISADKPSADLPNDILAGKVITELQQAFPNLGEPLWHKVITEKFATFACTSKLTRPMHLTPCAGLYLAGDYTYADYPATIEGAVRSGIHVSNYIINS